MEATLLTLGVILILVGLIGQVKAKEIEVGTKNTLVRIILGLIGVVFVIIALKVPFQDLLASPTTPTVPTPTPTEFVPTMTSTSPTTAEFVQQPTYTGDCNNRPTGSICIKYSDGYTWLVYDSLINWTDGGFWSGKKIEVANCYQAEYLHAIGTSFVKKVPKD